MHFIIVVWTELATVRIGAAGRDTVPIKSGSPPASRRPFRLRGCHHGFLCGYRSALTACGNSNTESATLSILAPFGSTDQETVPSNPALTSGPSVRVILMSVLNGLAR